MTTPKISLLALVLFSACTFEVKEEPDPIDSTALEELIEEEPSELYNTIKRMDSLYFGAQNACDLEKYASYLTDDLEFYHDVAGLTESKENEMSDMAVFCGEEQRSRQPLRRQLTEGTLKVFPMDNYGALQQCDHSFHLQINDGTEKIVGKGRLIALWKLENEEWKLARIVSYDHETVAEIELPDATLDLYVGDYQGPDRIVNIKKEGKLLRVTDVLDGEPGWTRELLPEADNLFYLNFENYQYEFIRNGDSVEKIQVPSHCEKPAEPIQ